MTMITPKHERLNSNRFNTFRGYGHKTNWRTLNFIVKWSNRSPARDRQIDDDYVK